MTAEPIYVDNPSLIPKPKPAAAAPKPLPPAAQVQPTKRHMLAAGAAVFSLVGGLFGMKMLWPPDPAVEAATPALPAVTARASSETPPPPAPAPHPTARPDVRDIPPAAVTEPSPLSPVEAAPEAASKPRTPQVGLSREPEPAVVPAVAAGSARPNDDLVPPLKFDPIIPAAAVVSTVGAAAVVKPTETKPADPLPPVFDPVVPAAANADAPKLPDLAPPSLPAMTPSAPAPAIPPAPSLALPSAPPEFAAPVKPPVPAVSAVPPVSLPNDPGMKPLPLPTQDPPAMLPLPAERVTGRPVEQAAEPVFTPTPPPAAVRAPPDVPPLDTPAARPPAPAAVQYTKPAGSSEVRPAASAATVERPPTTSFDVGVHEPRDGETYESISEEWYNSKRLAAALRTYNRNKPLQGQGPVEVPPIDVLRRKFPQLTSGGAARPAAGASDWTAAVRTESSPYRASGKEFMVPTGGMTMRAVARETLGRDTRWGEIYQYNPEITDPSGLLPAGTRLKLPPDARVQ